MAEDRAGRLLRRVDAVAYRGRGRAGPGPTARAADYRHQVREISAPVPVEGETATVFGRCAAEVSAAIRRSPAHWEFWLNTSDLAGLGLFRPQPDRSPAAVPNSVINEAMMPVTLDR